MADYKSNNYGKGKSNNYNKSDNARAYIPVDYLKGGYRDDTGVLDIKLITTQAEQLGKAIGNDGKTGASKIRSFYDEVTSVLTDCSYGGMKWTQARNKIAILRGRANTRFEKGTASKVFLEFISKNVNIVIESKAEKEFIENLSYFKDHFEAVICYLPKA